MKIIAIKRIVLVILFCEIMAIDGGEILENVYAKICFHFKTFCALNGSPVLAPFPLGAGIAGPIPLPPILPPILPPLPLPQLPAPNSPFPLPVLPGCPPYIIVCPLGSISPTITVPNIDIRLAAQIIVRTFNGCPCIDQRVGPALALGGLGGLGGIGALGGPPGPLLPAVPPGSPPVGAAGIGQIANRPPIGAPGQQQGGIPVGGGFQGFPQGN